MGGDCDALHHHPFTLLRSFGQSLDNMDNLWTIWTIFGRNGSGQGIARARTLADL